MANIQIPSLTKTIWKFNDILNTTTRGSITPNESEEGSGDNSVGYFIIDGEKYELIPPSTTIIFHVYTSELLLYVGNTSFLYIKTNSSIYESTTKEGEGWYASDTSPMRKLDISKIYLVLEQAYSVSQEGADGFLSELQANATQVNLSNTGWKFKNECNYFGDGSSGKRFNVNYISNYDKVSRTKLETPWRTSPDYPIYATIILHVVSGTYLKTTDYLYEYLGITTGEGWYVQKENNWIKQSSPPSIIITGGTDASAYNFITWLMDNAEEVELIKVNLSESIKTAGSHTVKIKAKAKGYIDSEFSNSVTYTVTPKLSTPVISLSGDTLIITPVTNATSYKILVDGTQSATTSNTSFDLTTLGLSSGTYTITVIASATDYIDSNASAGESYVVQTPITVIYSLDSTGHGEPPSIVHYSTDNGNTWIELQSGTTTIQASQIKFKLSGWDATGSSEEFALYRDVSGSLTYLGSGTYAGWISDNYPLSAGTQYYIYSDYGCFVEDTQIMLSDRSTKAIQNITYGDELLVYDLYEGRLTTAKPKWIMKERIARSYKKVILSNGIILKLVGPGSKCHRLFNFTKQKFLYADECVGDEVYTLNGLATVLSCEKIKETVKYYNLTTEKYYDCFAEGVLTGSRLNNMYHISNMKYDSNVRLISEKEEAERWKIREALRK